jgi:pilus assembly protein Flp/PilA
MTMKDLMRSFVKDESGQDMAEYALLLALIALVLVVAITAFKDAIATKFGSATSTLNNAAGS